MKLNDLFKSRRNIFFSIILITAFLAAGGIWQYGNYIQNLKEQAELKANFDKYYAEDVGQDIDGSLAQESAVQEGNVAQTAQEVVKTDSEKLPAADPNEQSTQKPTVEKTEATPAIKMQAPKMETMVLPVFGTVCADFSDTSLIYSKTLDQWMTHSGLDIKAEAGNPIRAAMDGTVSVLINDPQWGLTIVLEHGDGIYTKYCNLSTLDLVSIGQKVKKGDVISGVGKTALYEIADDSHLHFEVIKDGKDINPRKYLPKKSLQ